MEYQIDLIKDPLVKNNINFSEKYYFSSDKKSILGEVPFKEILFIEYRETEAGSNPREYTGLKKANLNIIKSLLKDHNNMFRFLHSGVNISLVNGVPDNSYKNITYDFCCLTNGNQTRFIILILVLLKILYGNNDLKTVTTKEYNKFIKEYFKDYPKALNVIPFIKPSKFNQVINFLNNNTKYLNNFKIMDFEEFLKSRIRVQINLIDSILQDLDEDLDEYSTGTLIAEANNDTQNVKVDDIFGNRYRRDLEEKIFKEFINNYKDNVVIEYRLGEVVEKVEKVHILALLRPVVATGLITLDRDIYRLTNQRAPIYRLFEKLLRKEKAKDCIEFISALIPFLYEIREKYTKPILDKHKRTLIRQYKEKALSGELSNTIISRDISEVKKSDQELERLIRKTVNFNIEHILPVLIFRIKDIINREGDTANIKLNLPNEEQASFLQTLTEVIYESYVETKLKGVKTSLSALVREPEFYEMGAESYKTLMRTIKFTETDTIKKYKYII